MRISDSLAEALAKWSYCHGSRVEVSEKAVEELLRALRQEDRVERYCPGPSGSGATAGTRPSGDGFLCSKVRKAIRLCHGRG
jgi:hypothetical protein